MTMYLSGLSLKPGSSIDNRTFLSVYLHFNRRDLKVGLGISQNKGVNGYFFSWIATLAQESRRDTIRLNTSLPGEESLASTQK